MTVLFVTHDIDEAIYLGSRVAILTRRPARLKTLLEVDLPRPGTVDMIVSERFVELKRTCMDLMREETLSFGRHHQKIVGEPGAQRQVFAESRSAVAV